MKDIESLKALIQEHVTLGELMKADGKILYATDEEQYACTFHGVDNKKSARYYRETDSAYCWVCKERLDVFSYTAKKEGISFGAAMRQLIQEYRVDTSKIPDVIEANTKKLETKHAPKLDNKALALERMKQAIQTVRDEVPDGVYDRFVYSFMAVQYLVPEE